GSVATPSPQQQGVGDGAAAMAHQRLRQSFLMVDQGGACRMTTRSHARPPPRGRAPERTHSPWSSFSTLCYNRGVHRHSRRCLVNETEHRTLDLHPCPEGSELPGIAPRPFLLHRAAPPRVTPLLVLSVLHRPSPPARRPTHSAPR